MASFWDFLQDVWDRTATAVKTRLVDAAGAPVSPATDTKLEEIRLLLDTVETKLQAISDNTDSLEGFTDGIEALLSSISGFVDGIEGFVDGLEGGIGATSDSASSVGGTGSLSAKLRLITTQLSVLDDWDESGRVKNSPIAGQAGIDGGAGAATAKTVRTVEAGLDGATSDGSVQLTGANTWVAIPSGTPPSTAYLVVITIENAAGTIRWSFDNGGTPSATNGNLAPGQLILRLAPSEVVYYGSTDAGDDVNFTTKVIT